MTYSKTNNVAPWAAKIWDEAISTDKVYTLIFRNLREAQKFRFALYNARTVQRRLNMEVYTKDDVEYGTSPWDTFQVTIRDEIQDGELVHALSIVPLDTPQFHIPAPEYR